LEVEPQFGHEALLEILMELVECCIPHRLLHEHAGHY